MKTKEQIREMMEVFEEELPKYPTTSEQFEYLAIKLSVLAWVLKDEEKK